MVPGGSILLARSHSPRRMSCRCLKFSTQPELPLNLSVVMSKDLAIASARSRISWSVIPTPLSDHSWRELSIASSTSGNFEGLGRKRMKKSQMLRMDMGKIQNTCVSRIDHIRPLHLYSATSPFP